MKSLNYAKQELRRKTETLGCFLNLPTDFNIIICIAQVPTKHLEISSLQPIIYHSISCLFSALKWNKSIDLSSRIIPDFTPKNTVLTSDWGSWRSEALGVDSRKGVQDLPPFIGWLHGKGSAKQTASRFSAFSRFEKVTNVTGAFFRKTNHLWPFCKFASRSNLSLCQCNLFSVASNRRYFLRYKFSGAKH